MNFACSYLLKPSRVLAVLVMALLSFLAGQNLIAQESFRLNHPVIHSFQGPQTSEKATPNPFTNYRLLVTYTHDETKYVVRGFYAADGNAAESGADSGNVWRVRFAPDRVGKWTYEASLRTGSQIAINDDADAGQPIEIDNAKGSFEVVANPVINEANAPESLDFRNRGQLTVDGGYFRFGTDGKHWLKAGADSPENFLAYVGFDGTYRTSDKARDGESKPSESLHRFPTHEQDWTEDDPSWQGGKGKSLIGAINYLSSTGMNVIYFLTNNIKGDGHDVWPYESPDDFTRFDCSKLDQWEIVFDHMQRKGILMHVVTQETENEKMLDDGDTGDLRKLYYRELIARFAHHPALVWNLGEENGPADFSPDGQNAKQQKAMSDYLKQSDPYHHPVVIHTHSTLKGKEEVLTPLLGHKPLDGLSFQVDNPRRVHKEVIQWKEHAEKSGHSWLIAMDEIGKWDTGVLPDSEDPDHDLLRHRVLWGSLMAGASGVEWYFGAKQQHNDLNCEDWRQHANMWHQSKVAIDFFEEHLPYWEMKPDDELLSEELLKAKSYCFAKSGEIYAIYLPSKLFGPDEKAGSKISLPVGCKFSVQWFDPKTGGELKSGSQAELLPAKSAGTKSDGVRVDLGAPPAGGVQDWVVLLKKVD